MSAPTRIPTRAELEDLIRHLALPYANGAPIFAYQIEEQMGVDVRYRDRLRQTYEAVVGPAGAERPGSVWACCQTCGQWQVINVESEVLASGEHT